MRKLKIKAYGDEPFKLPGPQLELWPELSTKIWPQLTRDPRYLIGPNELPNKSTVKDMIMRRQKNDALNKQMEEVEQQEKERWNNVKNTLVSDLNKSVKKTKFPELKKLRFSIKTTKYKGPFEYNLFTTGVNFDLNVFNAPKENREELRDAIMEVVDLYAPPDHQNRRDFYPKIVFK